MATTTLNPFRCDIDGVEQPNATFGVEMESTENGAVLDGEPLSGMSFSTTPNLWNYRESGKPWNFWYTYVVTTKPSDQPNKHTIRSISTTHAPAGPQTGLLPSACFSKSNISETPSLSPLRRKYPDITSRPLSVPPRHHRTGV